MAKHKQERKKTIEPCARLSAIHYGHIQLCIFSHIPLSVCRYAY